MGDNTSKPAALTSSGDVPVYGLSVQRQGKKKKKVISLLYATMESCKGAIWQAFSHPEVAEAVKGQVEGSAVTAQQFLDGFLLLR